MTEGRGGSVRRIRGLAPWAVLLVFVTAAPGAAQEEGLRFAPEASFTQSVGYFVAHREPGDRDDYQYDWRTRLGFAAVALDGDKLLWIESRLAVRTGRQPEGLGVDPSFVDLGFGFIGEWRLDPVTLWLGLDHASFHNIDRDLDISIWWWKIYAAAGTPGTRTIYDPWDVPLGGPGALARQWDWRFVASYWPTELPVLKDETSKGHPWKMDGLVALRATLWTGSRVGLQGHSHTGFARDRTDWTFRGEPLDGDWHGYQTLGLELAAPGERWTWSLALDAVLTDDRRPRFGRDGLVRVAVGLYY